MQELASYLISIPTNTLLAIFSIIVLAIAHKYWYTYKLPTGIGPIIPVGITSIYIYYAYTNFSNYILISISSLLLYLLLIIFTIISKVLLWSYSLDIDFKDSKNEYELQRRLSTKIELQHLHTRFLIVLILINTKNIPFNIHSWLLSEFDYLLPNAIRPGEVKFKKKLEKDLIDIIDIGDN